jgi:hypothetical protein
VLNRGIRWGLGSLVGGSPIFQAGKSMKPWAREGVLKPWHTWGSNPQWCRHRGCNVQCLDYPPACVLFFDKSNKPSIKLETAVTWSKSNLNMTNSYEESTINFWICIMASFNYFWNESLFRRTPKCIETKEKFHRVVHKSQRRQTLKPIEINIKVHGYEHQCLCRRTQKSIQTNTKVDRDEYLNP